MAEILHQLRLVVFPTIYKVLYIPGGCLGFLQSTVWLAAKLIKLILQYLVISCQEWPKIMIKRDFSKSQKKDVGPPPSHVFFPYHSRDSEMGVVWVAGGPTSLRKPWNFPWTWGRVTGLVHRKIGEIYLTNKQAGPKVYLPIQYT